MQEEQRPKVGLKEAVRIAIGAVRDLYEAQGYNLTDLLLEEVERSGGRWLITVGFTRPVTTAGGALGAAFVGPPRRVYKRVKIDAQAGEFLGMEIRELQVPSQAAQ